MQSGYQQLQPEDRMTIAEQLPKVDRWATLLRYICHRFAPTITTPMPQTALAESE